MHNASCLLSWSQL
jgi:hypothetical protein